MPSGILSLGCAFVLLVALPAELAAAQPPKAPAAAIRPVLLDAAFQSFLADQGRWAYTESHSRDDSVEPASIFRIDPSQPYAEQFVPIKINSHEPTAEQRKQWAERGGKEADRRHRRALEGKATEKEEADFRLRINGRDVAPDLDHAVVVAEDEASATYQVPLRNPDGTSFAEVQLITRVGRRTRQFEHVTIRQLEVMRVGAGKWSGGLTEIEFGSPDPRYSSVPLKITTQSTNKPLFGKAHTMHDVGVRTALRHVTPYDERFGVKIAPLRVIESF